MIITLVYEPPDGDEIPLTLKIGVAKDMKDEGFDEITCRFFPKGIIAISTTTIAAGPGSAYAYGMGQAVYILDPFDEVQLDASLKARFNPLDAIDPASDFAIDDAGRVAGGGSLQW